MRVDLRKRRLLLCHRHTRPGNRGAGDIIGGQQAGHVILLGAAFYQELLARAVRNAKGEATGPEIATELNIGGAGSIPTATSRRHDPHQPLRPSGAHKGD
jgi:hypothetical protein